jgi:hypothetical protein
MAGQGHAQIGQLCADSRRTSHGVDRPILHHRRRRDCGSRPLLPRITTLAMPSWGMSYRRSSPRARARLTASSRLCTPSRWYRRSARSLAADREMPSLSAMTENGTGCGR